MRLIGTLETETQAHAFYSFLVRQGIESLYEFSSQEKTGIKEYRIWVCNEDDLPVATQLFEEYKQNPSDPKFQGAVSPPPPDYAQISASEELKWQSVPPRRVRVRKFSAPLTVWILALCSFLFLWNDFQEAEIFKEKGELAVEMAMTPLEQNLFFDLPASYRYIQELIDTVPLTSYKEAKNLPPTATELLKQAEEAPSWRGIYPFLKTLHAEGWQKAGSVPMFEKIGQGELWRLFSPCLMHANFLHILFNMIWVWILSLQIEARLRLWKLCLMILIIGIVSNVVQYLVSGPYFLGFSGIIVGMAGFIWMRQKTAPWEGYPLPKSTILFLLLFVLAMVAIELFTFGLQLFSVIKVTPQIANTAHIVGGLVGILLGKGSFFRREVS
jgi:GlpG protein